MKVSIKSLTDRLGVSVEGLSVNAPLDAQTRNLLLSLLSEHAVVLLPRQDLTEAAQVSFGSLLGEVPDAEYTWAAGFPNWGEERHAPVYRAEKALFFTNGPGLAEGQEDPSAIWSDDTAQNFDGRHMSSWHTDDTDLYQAERVNTLYGVEVPERGGSTWFTNTEAAFADLPDTLKNQYRDYRALHFLAHLKEPPVDQPLVKRHALTGAEYLYLNFNTMDRIRGLDKQQSNQVLAQLYFHSTQSRYVYEHHWQKGDLLVWNCLGTMHRRGILVPGQRRVLRRIQVTVPELQSRREQDLTRRVEDFQPVEKWSSYPFRLDRRSCRDEMA